jgi:hypothetical protein
VVKEPTAEAIRITVIVAETLERLGIRHAIVGSLASSMHGIPRSTNDVDLVAAVRPEHADPLAKALGDAFYVDADMIRDAVARRSEFNVIHLATMFKIDIFVPGPDPIAQAQIGRSTTVSANADGTLTLRVASAEDTVAQKLLWYRHGGETSERQWLDTLGVIAIQGEKLDLQYLLPTADALGIRDLLERALAQAASGPPVP